MRRIFRSLNPLAIGTGLFCLLTAVVLADGTLTFPNYAGVAGSNGAGYTMSAMDASYCGATQPCSSPSPIASATTVAVVNGVAGQSVAGWYFGFRSNGTNTALTLHYFGSSTTNCAGTLWDPFGGGNTAAAAPTANQTIAEYGAISGATNVVAVNPAPIVFPAGYTVCVTLGGSAVSGWPLVEGTQH